MKTLKVCAIATIITSIIMLSCAVAMSANAEEAAFAPKLTIVVSSTKLEDNLWVVSCIDRFGEQWAFFSDTNDWDEGDIVNLLIWNGEEQEVIEVYWEGYTENIEMFMNMNGWCE